MPLSRILGMLLFFSVSGIANGGIYLNRISRPAGYHTELIKPGFTVLGQALRGEVVARGTLTSAGSNTATDASGFSLQAGDYILHIVGGLGVGIMTVITQFDSTELTLADNVASLIGTGSGLALTDSGLGPNSTAGHNRTIFLFWDLVENDVNVSSIFTWPHELGHVLLDEGSHYGETLPGGLNSGPGRQEWQRNLMRAQPWHDRDVRQGSKRLRANQIDAARTSTSIPR